MTNPYVQRRKSRDTERIDVDSNLTRVKCSSTGPEDISVRQKLATKIIIKNGDIIDTVTTQSHKTWHWFREGIYTKDYHSHFKKQQEMKQHYQEVTYMKTILSQKNILSIISLDKCGVLVNAYNKILHFY